MQRFLFSVGMNTPRDACNFGGIFSPTSRSEKCVQNATNAPDSSKQAPHLSSQIKIRDSFATLFLLFPKNLWFSGVPVGVGTPRGAFVSSVHIFSLRLFYCVFICLIPRCHSVPDKGADFIFCHSGYIGFANTDFCFVDADKLTVCSVKSGINIVVGI